jgi:hypothetical protein
MDYNYCSFPNKDDEIKQVELPYCYKIDNLNISAKNISFLLFPFQKNKIDNIYIENKSKA